MTPERLDEPGAAPRPASVAQIARAVFWSFFGIRKRSQLEQDAVTIKPLHAIIAGVIGMVLFVLALLAIVRLIMENA